MKKTYEAPEFFAHAPLDSVSARYYYYYYYYTYWY